MPPSRPSAFLFKNVPLVLPVTEVLEAFGIEVAGGCDGLELVGYPPHHVRRRAAKAPSLDQNADAGHLVAPLLDRCRGRTDGEPATDDAGPSPVTGQPQHPSR